MAGNGENWATRLITGTRNWWPNPNLDILRGHEAGRSSQIRTDNAIQTGPGPERIDRILSANAGGKSGPHVASLNKSGLIRIGHVPIRHIAQLPVPGMKFDDNAPIPALYAGNPL